MSLESVFRDTGMRVQVVVREQLARSVTNTRNYLDIYSLISDLSRCCNGVTDPLTYGVLAIRSEAT